jgi:hypothetical protein
VDCAFRGYAITLVDCGVAAVDAGAATGAATTGEVPAADAAPDADAGKGESAEEGGGDARRMDSAPTAFAAAGAPIGTAAAAAAGAAALTEVAATTGSAVATATAGAPAADAGAVSDAPGAVSWVVAAVSTGSLTTS